MSRLLLLAALAGCVSSPDRAPAADPADAGAAADAGGGYVDPLVHVARYDGPAFVEIEDVVVAGHHLYICTNTESLLVQDVSDPARPRATARVTFSTGNPRRPRCSHLDVRDDRLALSHPGDEVQAATVAVFDLGDPARPVEIAALRDRRSFGGVALGAGRLYAAAHDAGVAVFSLRDGALAPEYDLVGLDNPRAVAAGDGVLWVGDSVGLHAYPPDGDGRIGSVALGGAVRDIALDGARAVLATGTGGLQVVDVADPSAPVRVGGVATPGSALAVALAGGRAAVAAWNDFRLFDLSAADPALLATDAPPTEDAFSRTLAVAAAGDLVFAGEWTGLHVYRYAPGPPAPELRLSDREIHFGGVAPGEADAFALVVHNEGGAPLRVRAIATGHATLAAAPRALEVAPGGAEVVEVTFSPVSRAQIEAAMELRSDDPDEPRAPVWIGANLRGAAVGDAAPDFPLPDLEGEHHTLAGLRGQPVLLSYFATY